MLLLVRVHAPKDPKMRLKRGEFAIILAQLIGDMSKALLAARQPQGSGSLCELRKTSRPSLACTCWLGPGRLQQPYVQHPHTIRNEAPADRKYYTNIYLLCVHVHRRVTADARVDGGGGRAQTIIHTAAAVLAKLDRREALRHTRT